MAVQTHMIITAFGVDKIGLIAALTSRIADTDANISASKIVTIGADLASMMVVSAPKASAEKLRAGLG
jgi:glycine cleavage system regulatory protein